MDKITHYKKIVRTFVEEVVSLSPPEEDGIEEQLITDDEHGHYLYFGVGWQNGGEHWFYAAFIHIDVKPNGEVWLQHDGTDLRVAKRLCERGILPQDLILGFHPPYDRKNMSHFINA